MRNVASSNKGAKENHMFRLNRPSADTGFRRRTLVVRCLTGLIVVGLNTTGAYAACPDFDDLVPVVEISTSSIPYDGGLVVERPGDDYPRAATDGAVLVYRSTEPTTLQASRLPDGYPLWRFTTDGNVNSKPLVAHGMAFFGSDDGYFYALDERSGELIWKFDGRREVPVTKKVIEEVKKKKKGLFGGFADNLKDVVESARSVTETEYGPNSLRTQPAIIGDVIALYVPPFKVVGLNWQSGELVWEIKLADAETPLWARTLLPAKMEGIPFTRFDILGDRFALTFGGVWVFDAATGAMSIVVPTATESESDEQNTTPAVSCGLPVNGNILATLTDSSVALIGGRGEGILWKYTADSIRASYTDVCTEGDQAFALMGDWSDETTAPGGVTALDLATGEPLWVREMTVPTIGIWAGPKRVYVLSCPPDTTNRDRQTSRAIVTLDRETGETVALMPLRVERIHCLEHIGGHLFLGVDDDHKYLVLLNSESRASEIYRTTALSYDETQPAYALRQILQRGYPDHYPGPGETPLGHFTVAARDERSKLDISGVPLTRYRRWRLLSQARDSANSVVDVIAELTPIGTETDALTTRYCRLALDTLRFHLILQDSSWVIDSPLPGRCKIDTLAGWPLFRDTPGIAAHPSGLPHGRNKLPFTPGDIWRFRCTADTETDCEGYMYVRSQERTSQGSLRTIIFQEFPCKYQRSEALGGNTMDCSVNRLLIIDCDSATFAIEMIEGQYRESMAFPLPLKDGARCKLSSDEDDGYECWIKIETTADGEEMYVFRIDMPPQYAYIYYLSPTKGFLRYDHNDYMETNIAWKAEEFHKW
jgi:outer membrane protein assembly factor BamB